MGRCGRAGCEIDGPRPGAHPSGAVSTPSRGSRFALALLSKPGWRCQWLKRVRLVADRLGAWVDAIADTAWRGA